MTCVGLRGSGHLSAEPGSCVCAQGMQPQRVYLHRKVAAKGREDPGGCCPWEATETPFGEGRGYPRVCGEGVRAGEALKAATCPKATLCR